MIPKNATPGSHPVLIDIHGGFLAMAHSLFYQFFPPWVSKLALENSAILIRPDYRLLPSAHGVADILEDMEDFWAWTRSELPKILKNRASGHVMDLSKLFLTGSSGGGYLSIQLGLSHPEQISVLGMIYPLLDLKDDLYVKGPASHEANVLNTPSELIPSRKETIAWIEENRKEIASKAGFERTLFCVGACHHGLFESHMLDNERKEDPFFFPIERIKNGAQLPDKV